MIGNDNDKTRVSHEEFVSGYERLRRRALGKDGRVERGVGWALLVRQGMAHWMQVCGEVTAGGEMDSPRRTCGAQTAFAPDLSMEIVGVLASMALNHLGEANHENRRT